MILIIDDDRTVRMGLSLVLRHAGYEVEAVGDPDSAISAVRASAHELVLMDMNFYGGTSGDDGIALLRKVKILRPDVPVILISAWGSIPLAVEGVKYGAFDFITKPWNNVLLLQRIKTALAVSSRAAEVEADFDRSMIIGKSDALGQVLESVRRIAPTDASVLITGENGTGKELIAQAIHANSRRRGAPFVQVNLGGIPQSLFESEMFGYVRGAFTGAAGERKGRFELADGGTIFLDEIGELDLNCQVKMLRVLQEHSFERLGESRQRMVDIRVVSATNADLTAMLAERTFREDLYYRINTIVLHLPPLRERREDIPLLVRHFAASHKDRPNAEFTSDAMTYLQRLPYPGNVRQLKNIIDRVLLMSPSGIVERRDVEAACGGMPGADDVKAASGNAGMTLDEIERRAVMAALEKHSGNLSEAAVELGITRQSLYRRMEKYGIKQ